MNKIYTGIGSRETPDNMLEHMVLIGEIMGMDGYTLRSGGADGADTAFEQGCDSVEGKKEIFLPWKKFNENSSPIHKITKEAYLMASKFHQHWDKCNFTAKKLHARNCYQVLGFDLKKPSDFVVCWTKHADKIGGTALAIRVAEAHNIPVYNLADYDQYNEFIDKYIIIEEAPPKKGM